MYTFHSVGFIALFALFGQNALAVPARSELKSRNNSDDLNSVHQVCESHNINDDDPSSWQSAWDETTSGVFLDEWLLKHGQEDWVRRMDDYYMIGHSSRECSMATSCEPPDTSDCAKYVHREAGPLYWILIAASKLHEGLNRLSEKIQDNTIYDSLDVDKMISDLDADPPSDSDIFSYLSSAMVIGAGATAVAAPEVSGMLTIFSAAFTLAAANKGGNVDPTAKVKEQMAQVFKATQSQITEINNAALTGKGDVAGLPNQSGGWGTHIAGFFDNGRFLLNDMGPLVGQVVSESHKWMRTVMITTILRSQDFFVYVDDDLDEDSCVGGGMIFYQNRCYSFWQFTDDDTTIADNNHEDLWGILEDYNYDLTTMYVESWRCAEDGRGHPDVESLPMDGSLPVCFYNFPVVQGTDYEEYGEQWIYVDGGINTSGRDSAPEE